MWQCRLPVLFKLDLFKDGCSVRIWRRLTATTLSCCYTLTCWLIRGKFLQRFRELCLEIKEFLLVAKHAEYNQLNNDQWLLDLAFLTDLTNMSNKLNLELQGKDKTMVNMTSSVNDFKRKKLHLSSKLQRYDLRNVQNLVSEL